MRFAGDKLHFTGYDIGAGRQAEPLDASYDDLAYGEGYEYEEEGDYDDRGQWQIEMRQKEEDLVENAMRRIHRARLRGESNVDLSRDEIDALERRQLIPQPKPSREEPPGRPKQASAGASKSRKKGGGGLLGFGGSAPKAKPKASTDKRLALLDSSSQRSSPRSSPHASPQEMASPSPPYFPQPQSRPGSNPSTPPPRTALMRGASGANMRQAPYPYMPPEQGVYRSSSRRASPTRSLPDDPNWIPRSRSSSSAQQPPYPAGADPFAYQTGQSSPSRRNISGPATVSYSTVRRAPPPGAIVRGSSGSGLSQEVVDTSSSEDDDEEEEESDEGVTLDVIPQAVASGVASGSDRRGAPLAPGPSSGGGKPRKGRR